MAWWTSGRKVAVAVSLAVVCVGAALSGCGGAASRRERASSAAVAASAPQVRVISVATSPAAAVCREPEAWAGDGARARGISALLEGRPRDAADHLAEALRARPGDTAAATYRAASLAMRSAENARAARRLAGVPIVALDGVPLTRVAGAAPVAGPKVRLEQESERKNLITDEADWLTRHGLSPRVSRGIEGLPEHVGSSFRGVRLGMLFHSPDHDVAVYGTVLVASGPGRQGRAFDAAAPMRSGPRVFEVAFAQLVGEVLVVELSYNGYARDAGGKNGYLAAFDAATGRILWSSDPLIGNISNFHVAGGSVIAGYGFTAEPDFLHVVDVATGAVDQKIPVKSGPEMILVEGDRLHVRTYDTDYVFRGAGGLPPVPMASLARDAGVGVVTGSTPAAGCWARAAAAAIDRRDARALADAVEGLRGVGSDGELIAALEGAQAALAGRGVRRIDLAAAAPVAVAAPPWSYWRATTGTAKSGKAPVLVKVEARSADPVRALEDKRYRADRPFFVAPALHGALPPGAPEQIPSAYGIEELRAVIPSGGERLLLIYGGRYLASVRGGEVERLFDLDAFRHPPDPNPQWKEFAVQDVTFAQVTEGTVYVCNGGGSYAREVKGKKGFLSALDLATGALVWRSEPLVCNSSIVVAGEYLVTGYGFTDEPDFVFLIRRSDGQIVQRVKIDTGPETITMEERRVVVEAYGHEYVFELRGT